MKLANFSERTIDLDQIPREEYQTIYEASRKSQLTCMHCEQELRLYLAIHEQPHFIHVIDNHNPQHCLDYVDQQSRKPEVPIKEESSTEIGGFQLPKSRSIETTTKEKVSWKSPKVLSTIPLFKLESKKDFMVNDSYFQVLQSNHIYLDLKQWNAVKLIKGPLLVFAGAGSGKTRVLTARTAYMIHEKKIDPKTIMLVTFTTKAAQEIKDRLHTYPGITRRELNSLVTGTFHSIFYRILTHHDRENWKSDSLLKWEWQREKIIKQAGQELDLDEKTFAYDQALQQISFWKNAMVHPDKIAAKNQWDERTIYLYKRYEEIKKQKNCFDFDDMLYGCFQLLSQDRQLLTKYQKRFDYFLIDEFQDINKVQYEIMKLLSEQSQNICVVGDDDQSIYAFRGSDPSYLLQFERDFPTSKTVILDENYRSSHAIISVANQVIQQNVNRKNKKMAAQFNSDIYPILFFPHDEEEEATMIVNDVKEQIQNGANPNDFAILFRTHSASRALFERLSESHLPFRLEQDADSFYNRKMVRSLLSYIRLSIKPDDTEAMKDLLSALFIKQSALRDLKAFTILEDCSLLEALPKLENIQAFQRKKLEKAVPLFSRLKHLSPLSAITMIEQEMGFQDFLKKNGNEGNTIEKGSDEIRDLKVVAKKFSTISELLDHADHMIAMNKEMKRISKDHEHAIQLLTIHRAKGLEFEHVYVLGTVDGGLPHDYALDAHRNGDTDPLEEERRLLYVAMTRAKQTLKISVPEKRRGRTAIPSRFLKKYM